MNKKGKYLIFLLSCFVLVLAACSSETSGSNGSAQVQGSDSEPISIKFAHHMVSSSGTAEHIKMFTELVEERTGGKVEFTLYPDAQLGGETDVVENVLEGTIHMTLTSSPTLGGLSKRMNLLNVPYLWKNNEYAYEVLHGPVGDELNQDLIDEQGLRILTWYAEGFRNVFAKNNPIESLEDWKGLTIRSPESDAYLQAFSALGANPTPVPWPEVYTALQTGVVDAAEAPYDSAYAARFQEVAKDVSTTQHIFISQVIMINENMWKSLPSEVQKVFQETALEVSKKWLDAYPDVEDQILQKLKDEGATIYEVSDAERERMVEAAKPTWEQLGNTYEITSLIEQMLNE